MEKPPYVPTEIHVGIITDADNKVGVLSIQTAAGQFDFAINHQAADAIVKAMSTIRVKLEGKPT